MAEQTFTMHPVAHIESDFAEKFGIPRQSGLVDALRARVVFEPPYRDPSALRGIEQFSHIWLLWQFTQAMRADWSPTVRPPRLGGNTRVGVFATRSPFRPNPIGLSCVRLEKVEQDPARGPVLLVRGADLLDGTPIYDIKPYIPFCGQPPRRRRGLHRPDPDLPSGGALPRSAAGLPCAGAVGGPGRRLGRRPPALLSGRPGPGLWDAVCRV